MVYPFLIGCFGILQDAVSSEWDKGAQDNGILTINIGIYAFIRVLDDIVDYLVHQKIITPTIDKVDLMIEKVSPYKNSSSGDTKDAWDFITLSDCKHIVTMSGNWSEIFESSYSDPKLKKAKKGTKTAWMDKASKILSQNFETYSISEEEYAFVNELYNWLVTKKINV